MTHFILIFFILHKIYRIIPITDLCNLETSTKAQNLKIAKLCSIQNLEPQKLTRLS